MKKKKGLVILIAVLLSVVLFSFLTLEFEKRNAAIEQNREISDSIEAVMEEIRYSDQKIQSVGYSKQFSFENTINSYISSCYGGAIDLKTGQVLYCSLPGETEEVLLTNCSMADAGLTKSQLFGKNGRTVTLSDGKKYYANTREIITDSFGDILIFNFGRINSNFYPDYNYGFILAFAFTTIVVSAYAIFLKSDAYRSGSEERLSSKMKSRLLLLILGCGLFIFILGFWLTNLLAIKVIRKDFQDQTNIVNYTLSYSLKLNEDESHDIAERGIGKALEAADEVEKIESSMLSGANGTRFIYYELDNETGANHAVPDCLGNPTTSLRRSAYLQSLCRSKGIDELRIYDCNGRVIASSSDIWNGKLDDESFINTLFRQNDSCTVERDGYFYIGVPIDLYVKSEDDETRYCKKTDPDATLEYGLLGAKIISPEEHLSFVDCYDRTLSSLEGLLYSNIIMLDVSGDTPQILYLPEKFADMRLKHLGLGKDECFLGNYLGAVRIADTKYLVKCEDSGLETNGSEYDGNYFYAYLIDEDIISGSGIVTGTYLPYTILGMILLLLLAFFVTRISNEEAFEIDGGLGVIPSDSEEEEDASLNFRKRSSENKLFALIKQCLRAIVFIIVIYGTYEIVRGNKYSIFWHVLNGDWSRGLNFISITACIGCFMAVMTGIFFIGKILDMLSKNLSSKAQTFCRLAVSIAKYIGIIFCIFYSLYLFGMDVTAVLTSLGAFSVLIGLGAQSLIKDILAGFFLLIEGQFKIGDIITIGNYTGRVKEIGLRSTKCENLFGDITIFSNSSINQLENHSKKLSKAYTDSPISMSIPVSDFEKIIQQELPGISERLKDLTAGGVTYDGVISINAKDKVYLVRLSAPCHELNRGKLKHALSKEMLSIANNYSLSKL